MAFELWSQDNFSKGELSPYMYARSSVNQYYNGMKTAQNVLTYPTGAAGKRFGTLFNSLVPTIPDVNSFYFQTFQYLSECVYQLVFYPLGIGIYLEGLLVNHVDTTLNASQVYNLSNTVLGSAFRVAGQGFKPYDLTRKNDPTATITGISSNAFTVMGNTYTASLPLPLQFTTTGGVGNRLPATTPQIVTGVTYFGWTNSSTSLSIYTSAYNAKYQIDPITLLDVGVGTNYLTTMNTWDFLNCSFKNLPVYDFNGNATSYDDITFTPTAIDGAAMVVNLDAPYGPLAFPSAGTSQYKGGAFTGGGGVSRIVSVQSNTQFTVAVQMPFDAAAVGIKGSLVFLAQPAWSDARGWPQKCSSYQNRSLFANTVSLPNGFWASFTNDYTDFDDSLNDDDYAISWFPSSDDVNAIRFIVPYRSITVHTNTGIYSSPLSDISAITPNNFTLLLQDSTPADVLQPRAIDNQILVVSGNDCHTMLWDGINNAYTSDIVSVVNEQLIRDPVDETPYADLRRAGSRYIFIINANGSMAVYQTLISQEVSGFTPQIMEQSLGKAQFRQAASSADGRCWFITERDIATIQPAILISGYTSNTLTAVGSGFDRITPTAITFATSAFIPTSSPQINTTEYFWAIGVTGDTFMVYTSQSDAKTGSNPITFTSSGTASTVIPWFLLGTFMLEELNQDVNLDCAVYYNGTGTSTVTTGGLFNAQEVKMKGDGFGFDAIGFNNQVAFEAHGSSVLVEEAYIGFPINLVIEPMPLSMTTGQQVKNTSLTKPKHISTVRFMFNNTIGGTINGVPIALSQFNKTPIGTPPTPQRGIFEMGIQKGWDDFNNPSFRIEHNEPFNIELLGVFYNVEV